MAISTLIGRIAVRDVGPVSRLRRCASSFKASSTCAADGCAAACRLVTDRSKSPGALNPELGRLKNTRSVLSSIHVDFSAFVATAIGLVCGIELTASNRVVLVPTDVKDSSARK